MIYFWKRGKEYYITYKSGNVKVTCKGLNFKQAEAYLLLALNYNSFEELLEQKLK